MGRIKFKFKMAKVFEDVQITNTIIPSDLV